MSATEWVKIKNQNLAVATRDAGFDLAMYDNYSEQTQSELRKQAISWALEGLADEYEDETGDMLKNIRWGVYVIRISDPFTIQYQKGLSPIVYIGRGAVLGRLKSHYSNTLFDFMQSLSGASFDFWIAEPKRVGRGLSEKLHKQLEHNLLEAFSKRIGGDKNKFPLLNKNSGSNKGIQCDEKWDQPLNRQGMRPKWILEPTKHWAFSKLG